MAAGGGMVLAIVACRSTQGDATPTKPDTSVATPAPADAAAVVDASARQSATFSLLSSDTTPRRRRFVPGLSISRIDLDGGATRVTLDPPVTSDAGDAITAGPLTPGHYRAHFLVAACAPDSPDGGCRATNTRPDETDFDVPASGDVEVTVR